MGNELQSVLDVLAALNPFGLLIQFLNFVAAVLNQWFAGTGIQFQGI